jgi:sensor c-di-GMP phosphodiesterase-like protein
MARAENSPCNMPSAEGSSQLFAILTPWCRDKAVQTHNLALRDKVRRALQDQGSAALAYQPLVDATTHQAVSYECLLRMQKS